MLKKGHLIFQNRHKKKKLLLNAIFVKKDPIQKITNQKKKRIEKLRRL